jgi:hypothetical protein
MCSMSSMGKRSNSEGPVGSGHATCGALLAGPVSDVTVDASAVEEGDCARDPDGRNEENFGSVGGEESARVMAAMTGCSVSGEDRAGGARLLAGLRASDPGSRLERRRAGGLEASAGPAGCATAAVVEGVIWGECIGWRGRAAAAAACWLCCGVWLCAWVACTGAGDCGPSATAAVPSLCAKDSPPCCIDGGCCAVSPRAGPTAASSITHEPRMQSLDGQPENAKGYRSKQRTRPGRLVRKRMRARREGGGA